MGLKRFFFKQFFWVFLPQKKVENPGNINGNLTICHRFGNLGLNLPTFYASAARYTQPRL